MYKIFDGKCTNSKYVEASRFKHIDMGESFMEVRYITLENKRRIYEAKHSPLLCNYYYCKLSPIASLQFHLYWSI